MGLRQTVAPTALPLTLNEAKHQVAELGGSHDEYLDQLIKAATAAVERYTSRALITQTWEKTFDAFDCEIWLPHPPLQSVSSVKYIDQNGALQTLDDSVYQVSIGAEPAKIELAYEQSWPTIRCVRDAVRITYIAGYGDDSSSVPEPIRHALKLLVSQWFMFRESVISGTIIQPVPLSAQWLLNPYDMTSYA